MSAQEYLKLLRYIAERNGWRNGNFSVKYVECSFDTRDNRIWKVTFRGMGDEITFRTECGYDLKTRIYEHLKRLDRKGGEDVEG